MKYKNKKEAANRCNENHINYDYKVKTKYRGAEKSGVGLISQITSLMR